MQIAPEKTREGDPATNGGTRHVVFVIYEDASLFTMMGFLETFKQIELERGAGEPPAYRVSAVSSAGGMIGTYFGFPMPTVALAEMEEPPIDTMILTGGLGFRQALADRPLIDWIARRGADVRRLCTVGTGTFLGAEAGLLNGRRVVTHWLMNEEFRETYPDCRLEPDLIFVRDPPVWSAAGMSSAIDFALAIVEEDFGRRFAFRIAERLVVFLKRSGEQPQVSAALKTQARSDGHFETLHEWIVSNLSGDLRVENLAARCGMSVRNFTRVYAQKVGVPPSKSVERLRVEAACRALADTDERIATIAGRCGFVDEQRMRRAFLRVQGIAPNEYRIRAHHR